MKEKGSFTRFIECCIVWAASLEVKRRVLNSYPLPDKAHAQNEDAAQGNPPLEKRRTPNVAALGEGVRVEWNETNPWLSRRLLFYRAAQTGRQPGLPTTSL